MDLSFKLEDTTLNVRVAGLVKTKNGYLFEKNEKGYIFALGGRVMLNESSKEAMVREAMEEIGFRVNNLVLRSVIEIFYGVAPDKVHEICFVYEIDDLYDGVVPENFIEVPVSELDNHDVRPREIVDILKEIRR